MKISEKILLLIRRKGMTQKNVAKKLGVKPVTISGYVRGTFLPSVAMLWQLSRLLGVSTDYLLDESLGWPPPDSRGRGRPRKR